MSKNKDFEKINKNICKFMDTDLDAIGFAFFSGDNAMEIPDMYEFCKWWVKKYPDKFILLKGRLYDFRKDRANLFNSIGSIMNAQTKNGKRLSPFTLFQMQMLTNNCIDQTNATCQLVQSLVAMCEKILRGE